MPDWIRDTPVSCAIRFITKNGCLQYPEERPDFQLPPAYNTVIQDHKEFGYPEQDILVASRNTSLAIDRPEILENSDLDLERLRVVRTNPSVRGVPYTNKRLRIEQTLDMQRTISQAIVPQKTSDGVVLVDWYTTDDPANPQNWSSTRKGFVVFLLACYTFTVYCAGPIWSAASPGIQERFGVSPVVASLGLSLYVLAYGVGDLLFSPLTEIPVIGRNPVHYLTFVVFWILSFPEAVCNSFAGLLVLRFLLGFFGSPALANGGATISDMYSLIYVPYGLSWWVFSAWSGPAFGPLIGGFAAQAKNWRWPFWEIVWMASIVLLSLLLFMPETSAPNILLRRAQRLRKLTGNDKLQSQSEIDQRNMAPSTILFSALIRPIEIMLKDPSIFFVNLYTGYFYGVFYTFFEVFPLVFPPLYHFNLGETGLAFLSCMIGVTIAILGYFAYLRFYMIPDNLKNGLREQEHRLVPAIVGSFFLPVGLFLFAWTSNPNIHWSVPLVGVGLFCIGHFLTMQSLFIYIPFSYPQYAASLFAGNSVWRSVTAGAAVVFARPLFINLGIHRGVSLLAGLSVMGVFGTTAIYVFGKQLRARSKFAQS